MANKKILIIGGAGYVGAVLVPKLLKEGYYVRVLDLYTYGDHVFVTYKRDKNLKEIKGDLRDQNIVYQAMQNIDTVIHLACISNDPSFDLNPNLGRSVNYESLPGIINSLKGNKVKRLIFASSAAIYGLQSTKLSVNENFATNPQTDYAKYKLLAEKYILQNIGDIETVIVRSATVCGYSPRMRLDVLVNMFTAQAFNNKKINVYTGSNIRPHIHIQDITDFYCQLISAPRELINGKIFNANGENITIKDLAEMVRGRVRRDVVIEDTTSADIRSCKLDHSLALQVLKFKASHTIQQAIDEVYIALKTKVLIDSANNPLYYNIKMLKLTNLK